MLKFTEKDEELLESYEKAFEYFLKCPKYAAIAGVLTFLIIAISNEEIGLLFFCLSPVAGILEYYITKILIAPMVLVVKKLKKMVATQSIDEVNVEEKKGE